MIILIIILAILIIMAYDSKYTVKEKYRANMSQYIDLPNDNNPFWLYEKVTYYPAFNNPNYRFPHIL